jgi:transposase-like protein
MGVRTILQIRNNINSNIAFSHKILAKVRPFWHDYAVMELFYWALRNIISRKWTMALRDWKLALIGLPFNFKAGCLRSN